jgi:hypothetical protein
MLRRRESREHEDAGADDAADAEGDQRRDSQSAYQVFAGGFLLIVRDRFGGEQTFFHESCNGCIH